MQWIALHEIDVNECFACGEIPGEDGVAGAYFAMFKLNEQGLRYVDPHSPEKDRAASYHVVKRLLAPMPIHEREAAQN
jgi:hypothetical protein